MKDMKIKKFRKTIVSLLMVTFLSSIVCQPALAANTIPVTKQQTEWRWPVQTWLLSLSQYHEQQALGKTSNAKEETTVQISDKKVNQFSQIELDLALSYMGEPGDPPLPHTEPIQKEEENKGKTSVADSVYLDEKPEEEPEENGEESVFDSVYEETLPEFLDNDASDRFIIKYRSNRNIGNLQGKAKDLLETSKKLGNENFDFIKTKTKTRAKDLITQLQDQNIDTSNIEYIQSDYILTTLSYDPQYNEQWGLYNKDSGMPDLETVPDEKLREFLLNDLKSIGMPPIRMDANVPDAWTQSQGNGVIVAVLDTGLDSTHPDLIDNIWSPSLEIKEMGFDVDKTSCVDQVYGVDETSCVDQVYGGNFLNYTGEKYNQNTVYDEWHATHVAGIIGAVMDNGKGIAGVAPKAKIMPLKVFQNGIAYTSDIINAIEYAAENGAKIVNCSWGTAHYNPALKEAIEASGMLFVCAAGNNHTNIDTNPVYPASFDCPNIITVASIDQRGVLSGFSNYGESSVDVAAPGEDILSILPGDRYGKSSGTSMATAFVSGAAALILGQYEDEEISPEEVKKSIMGSADRLSSLIGKVARGNKINCGSAIYEITNDQIIEIPAKDDDDFVAGTDQGAEGYQLFAADSFSGRAPMQTARRNFGAVESSGGIYAIGGNNGTFLNTVEKYDPDANSWSYQVNMPTAREGAAVVEAYDKIYVIGGYNGGYLNNVEEYDPATNIWTTNKASMPTKRQNAGAAVVNGKIYVIGGYNGNYLNKVEVYDPLTNTWATLASMTTPRTKVGVQTMNGKIYALGGNNGSYLNLAQEFDPSEGPVGMWSTKRSMSTARDSFGIAVANNKIYAIGGYNGSNYLSTVEEYNPALDSWVIKSNMTTPRAGVGSAAWNSQIYVMGGYNGSFLKTVERYVPATDVWITKAPMPTTRGFSGTASANGKIYVAGGTCVGNSAIEYEAINTFEAYDPETNTWTVKPNMPTARFGLGAAEVDGKIYAIGGWNFNVSGWELNTVEAYDPVTNTWASKASMIERRYACAVVELNGKIYAIGGYIENSIEVYDPLTNTWTAKASMPTARYALAAGAVDGKIYAIGGYDGNKVLNTVEAYDPSTNTWSTKASMPTARNYLGVTVINGKIYAIGGSRGNYLNTVEVYDPATDKWTSAPGMSVGRMRVGVTAANGKIYAAGGYKGTYLNTLEEYTAEYDRYLIQKQFGENGIHPASGNFSRKYTDMYVNAPGFIVDISRIYNSLDNRVGPLGRGWTFGFEGNIKTDPSYSSIKVTTLPDGSVQTFAAQGGGYTALDSRSKLVMNGDGTYTLTTKDQYTYTFNTSGWLVRMQDRHGNKVQIDVNASGAISKITDPAGRYYTVDYAGTANIRRIREYANGAVTGRIVEYQYENNQLIRAIDPMGNNTRYAYDSSGYLTEIRDHQATLLESVTYIHEAGDQQHKVSRITDGKGNTLTYAYDTANRETSITDSTGRQIIQYYDDCLYISSSKDAEGKTTTVEYDIDITGVNKYGEEKSITDRNGNKTEYERDSRGNITKTIHPDASYIGFTYDEKNNLLSERDETGKYIFYVYDTNKVNLVKKARPLNGTDLYYQGCDESKFAIITYTYYTDTEAQQLGYKAKGLLKTERDPEGNVTTYTYDANGNIKTVTDPENTVTTYNYNQIGWKTGEVSPKLYQTTYVYDSNGRIEKTTLHGGEVTRTTYDNMGRKVKEVPANLYNPALDNNTYSGNHGYRYFYYPSGLLQTVTDPESNTTAYTYDVYGNVLTETKPYDGVYVYSYDVLNRLTNVQFKDNEVDEPVLLETDTYLILENGNTKVTKNEYLNDTQTAVTSVTYDYAGRPIRQDNPDGTYTTTAYNANGTVASTTDERGNTTHYKYDGLNRLTEQWSPAENVSGAIKYIYTAKVYDKASRVKEEKIGKTTVALYGTPAGFATTYYTYYRDGSLKAQSDSAGRKTEYQYDADGYLSKEDVYTAAANKITTEYVNNYFGKPIEEKFHVRQGDLFGQNFANNTDTVLTTTYTYDKNGNLKTGTRPDGVVITYTYDNLDRQTRDSQPGQDEFGSPVTVTRVKAYNWNHDVRVETDENNRTTSYTYDPRGFLTKVTDAKGKVAVAYYDRAGRVIAEVSPNNYVPKTLSQMNRTEYTYDLMGRIKTKSYTYVDPSTGQWVSYVAKAYKYDAKGNIIKELDALGYEAGAGGTAEEKINSGYGTEYTYDLDDKLVIALDPVNKDRGLSYTTKYEYDSLGRTIKETDANGNNTAYTYDDADNILTVKVNNQTIQTNTYDLADNLLTQRDGNGNTIVFEYNAFGQLRKTILPGDSSIPVCTITYQYDVLGNLKQKVNSAGPVDLYTYDNQGRELFHTRKKSDGSQVITTSIKYDKAGNQRFVTDGNNVTTEYTFNEINQPVTGKVTVTNISGTPVVQITTYGYDNNGNQTTQTDWRGNTYTNVYDPINRLIRKIDPFNKTIERLEYNHNSVQIRSYDALGKLTQYTYDKNNRLIGTIDPLNHTTSQTYDNVGNIKTKTDGRNKTTTYNYDEFNRLTGVVNAKNETTVYTYDLNGNLLTQTDGKGNVTTFEYNAANKPVRKIDHGGRTGTAGNYTYIPSKVERYNYYADGNLTTKLDRNGKTTTYIYDVHGRMLSQIVGSINISYTYDGNGNQLTITDSTGTTSRTYDQLNRVKTKTVPNTGTITFLYDDITGLAPGQIGEISTDPKGNVTKKVFDKAGRLVKVIAGSQETTYTYYDNGSRRQTIYPNGALAEYTYYDDNLLHTLVNKRSDGTVISSYAYTYDEAHNQIAKVDSRGTTTYDYDDINRLITVTEPGEIITIYGFDAAGNRAEQTLPGERSLEQTLRAITCTYDLLNRMNTASLTGINAAYIYNGEGYRVGKTVNGQAVRYLWEADQIILELDGSGNQAAQNVWGINLISRIVNGETFYYMYNGHGDVTALIDGNGVIRAAYDYDAFGNLIQENYFDANGNATTVEINNPIRYAGYQYDKETGYYYLIARYYDPATGRFTTEDTYLGQINDPLSLNLYTYCKNDPMMYTDPLGHKADGLYKNKDGSYTRTVNGKNYTVTKNDSRYNKIANEYKEKEKNNVSGTANSTSSKAGTSTTKDKQKDMVNAVSGKSTNDMKTETNSDGSYALADKVERLGGTITVNKDKNGKIASATVTMNGKTEVYTIGQGTCRIENGRITVGGNYQGTSKNEPSLKQQLEVLNLSQVPLWTSGVTYELTKDPKKAAAAGAAVAEGQAAVNAVKQKLGQEIKEVADDVVNFLKSDRAVKGSANPKVKDAATKGRQMHKDYDYGPGVQKEKTLPSGKRMDGYDAENTIIHELKPNNPNAIKRGMKQLDGYIEEANKVYGPGHSGKLHTYNK